MHHFAYCAPEVHTFWPVTTHSSPSLTALVFSAARSEPASGSLKPWHQCSEASRIAGRKRSFCSSVPHSISVGPPMTMPRTLAGSGRRARPSSSKKIADSVIVAPRPPYSRGQCTPAQPPSLSWRCQSRDHANCAASSSSTGRGPGSWLSSQARSSSRNALSVSEKVRSMSGASLGVDRGGALEEGDGGGGQLVEQLGQRVELAGAHPRAHELVDAGREDEERVVGGHPQRRVLPQRGAER